MRLIIYSFVGLLVATSYYIPQLQGILAENPEFDSYRIIAINVVLARLLIEGLVGRLRWKKVEDQLQSALGAQQELSTLQSQEQQALKQSESAVIELKKRLAEAAELNLSLNAKLSKSTDDHEELRVGFEDLSKKYQELTILASSQSSAVTGDEAVNLLSLLQQKGRFVDFVMEDISSVPDAQIGAAARVVHQGCSLVLKDLFNIIPVNDHGEGHKIVISNEADVGTFRLVGRVRDEPPYEGTLLHRGWQTDRVDMPRTALKHKISGPRIIAPAEVELS